MIKRAIDSSGYRTVSDISNADIIIVNSCGVKKQTEDRVLSFIKGLNGKKTVLTGCLPLINKERILNEVRVDAMTGPSIGTKILDVLKAIDDGSFIDLTTFSDISPLIDGKDVSVWEPIGISNGCLDRCSFCATKFARRSLNSHPIEKLVRYIKLRSERGVKEFYLTSPDTGAYGYDLKPRRNIIDLLREIEKLDGDFRVRLGMINPRWIYKWLDEFIEIFSKPRHLYEFLHIPVQSGSDRMLDIMNRGHTTEEYVESVRRLRKEVDIRFNVSTDIIVGHPSESDEDFEMTLDLIRETEPDIVNISKFFPRPGTASKRMKQVPTNITKMRSRILTELSHDIMLKRNKLWVGWIGKVLIDETGNHDTLVGRNYAFKPLVLKDNVKIGEEYICKVINAHSTWLEAAII
jgi:MiaB-like tRNA modifying enzyme